MEILITGATGLIGSALVPYLKERGHNVTLLRRTKTAAPAGQPHWNPQRGEIDLSGCRPFDAVIHLAGESIAQRWSAEVKRRILESRVKATGLLCEGLLRQSIQPKCLLCASATGYYGDRGDDELDEQSKPGTGFLAEVCQAWEGAAGPAARNVMRVVNLRFGIVLSGRGGALKKMLVPFRLGLGGKFGNGRQFWSWISIHDLLAVVELALTSADLEGPVNVVSPHSVRNAEFTKTLAAVLHRPALFSVPKPAIKLLMGEMGEEALLSSFRVKPAKLEKAQFPFKFPELKQALEHLVG
jgi:uncharacterized protein (TIGR01777 family)